MNPYAKFLDGREPVEIIAATAPRLAQLVSALDPDAADRAPAPGKWSVREILCHLADCELVFAYRIRQTLAEDRHVIQPFDQDVWARNYAAYSTQAALATFAAVREWNGALIRTLDAAALGRAVNHPERGEMNLRTIVETMAGHDLNHLRQVEALARGATAAV
jgi:uncharacterized damage-inducible protein DinB